MVLSKWKRAAQITQEKNNRAKIKEVPLTKNQANIKISNWHLSIKKRKHEKTARATQVIKTFYMNVPLESTLTHTEINNRKFRKKTQNDHRI